VQEPRVERGQAVGLGHRPIVTRRSAIDKPVRSLA
jgi:hypothetical protein